MQRIGTSTSLGLERDRTSEYTLHSSNRKRYVITAGINTMAYAKALCGALGVVKWAIGSQIAQRPLGTIL